MILTGLFGGRRRDAQTWAEFSRPVCLGEDLGRWLGRDFFAPG